MPGEVTRKADARQSDSSRPDQRVLVGRKTGDKKEADAFPRVWTKITDCPAG